MKKILLVVSLVAAMAGNAAAEGEVKVSVFSHTIYQIARERGVPLVEAVRLLRQEGVTGFDINFQATQKIEELIAAGIRPINFYGFVGMFDDDGGEKKMDAFVAAAVKYAVPRIMLLPDHFPGHGKATEESFRKIVERTRVLVAKAQAKGVTVNIETFGYMMNCCSYAKYVKRMLDDVPGLGFALDTGNLYCCGRTDDIVDVAQHAGRRIRHVHLKDYTAEHVRVPNEDIPYVSIGLGVIPNEECVRYAVSIGYDEWYTLENPVGEDKLDDVVRQIAVLKRWIRRGREAGPIVHVRKDLDLQREIDAAAAKGGGKVTVKPGDWVVRPFVLKSNIELCLEQGATLYASTNLAHYSVKPGTRAFVYAEGAENVAITGPGTLNGQGWAFKERSGLKGESQPVDTPIMLRFSRCRQVKLEDFTYRDGGAWGCHLRNCDGVTVRRVKCYNHINESNDGIDIESANVLIEDCDVDADDDALVFKAESDVNFAVTNVVVRNCRFASDCNAIKFGTGSWADFRDITIEHCKVLKPFGSYRFLWKTYYWDMGLRKEFVGLGGISLEVVDGGRMENIVIRDIDMEDAYMVPIFIRQHRRNPPVDKERGTYLRNILLEDINVQGASSRCGCSITGVPGLRPHDITLRNVTINFPGGGTAEDAGGVVKELETAYPEGVMFKRNLPAWGFYLRHVDNVRFENVKLNTLTPDARPAIVKDDCR